MSAFNVWWIGKVGLILPRWRGGGYSLAIAGARAWRIPAALGRFLVWAIFSRLGVLS